MSSYFSCRLHFLSYFLRALPICSAVTFSCAKYTEEQREGRIPRHSNAHLDKTFRLQTEMTHCHWVKIPVVNDSIDLYHYERPNIRHRLLLKTLCAVNGSHSFSAPVCFKPHLIQGLQWSSKEHTALDYSLNKWKKIQPSSLRQQPNFSSQSHRHLN